MLALLVAAVAAWFAAGPGGGAGMGRRVLPPARAAAVPRGLPAAEAGLLPWHLAEPVSREVAVAGPPGQLLVAGGLVAGGGSANGVYAVRTATGATRRIGALGAALHDAAAAVSGGRALIFGGGSPATVATVQAFPLAGPGGGTRPAAATSAGSLPAPRSDAAAVTIGGTTYLVGGYDGTRPDAAVLATTDGRAFTTVTALPVPVRYPAVAALGGRIYVFGGQAITGPRAGAPVNVIQAVDPARHTAAVIGALPEPLAGAAAVTVAGELFVAGGESPVAQRPVPGLGTTQLGPAQSGAAAGAEASSSPTPTVSTIWAFDPASRRLLAAGHLQVPVSHAAVVVAGAAAWIIGGESGGKLVSAVQMLRPTRAFGTAGAPGGGLAVFRGQAAGRRPRQQPAPGPGRPDARAMAVPAGVFPAARAAVVLPRRRVLHRPRHRHHLQPGAERDHHQDRLPVRERSSGPTATPGARAPLRATCPNRTTRTCSRTGRSRWLMPTTAGCW